MGVYQKDLKGYFDEITFTHKNKEYTFKTEPNPLNNCQMWWFEPQASMYAGTVAQAKEIAKDIREKHKKET